MPVAALSQAPPALNGPARSVPASPNLAHNEAHALVLRADSHAERWEPEAAIQAATEAIRLNPGLARAWIVRSRARTMRGDTVGAQEDGTEAVRLDPRSYFAWAHRANARMLRGRFDEAAADVQEAMKLNDKEPFAWAIRGAIRIGRHDAKQAGNHLDEGLKDLFRAASLRPSYDFAFLHVGRVYERQGKHDAAIAEYDKVLKLRPSHVHARINRGLSKMRLNRLDEAIADFREANRLDPHSSNASVGLARALEAKQDLAAASTTWRSILDRKPEDAEARSAVERLAARIEALRQEEATRTVQHSTSRPTRVALVIGNGAYRGVPRLENPPRDAELIANSLRDLGFKTVHAWRDLNRGSMLKALRDFSALAAEADWAVIYFAGHGIEIDGRNYLLPVDAKLQRDLDVDDEAIPLERVLKEVAPAKKLRLVILDACRNNPFASRMKRSVGTRSVGDNGLAKVERQPQGTVLLYAAEPGSFALDNVKGSAVSNSPFADALSRHMRRPGVDIGRMFRSIAADVRRVTENQQQPYYTEGSLPDEDLIFYQGGG
jgi:tetratricopeptide (TPR) repeat protein